ncbi:hypothetical protein [Gemmiger sp. An50]|uniref:hypothetical protein n=1 Tax=Gemmiger sp. An50 TaxID=1965639 RepID=UPI0013A62CFD|nr:hypothetical protein [Gemmiger sp. An50]
MKQELRSFALLLFGILLVEASRTMGGLEVDERSQFLLLAGLASGLWGLIRMFFPKE